MTAEAPTTAPNSALADAVGIGRSELVGVVGAGGIKPFLYRLTEELDAVLTSTVGIPIFDDHVAALAVTEDPVSALENHSRRPLGLVPARQSNERYRGYSTERVDEFAHLTSDQVIVKADGARSRLLKAPDDHEPQLPETTDIVCPLASVKAVGESLTEATVHRPERVASVTECSPGEALSPWDIASVIASHDGGLKCVPRTARVVPVLTMVETASDEMVADRIAGWVREHPRVERVVAVDLTESDPVREVY
ncbi:selenium cofactor biosynthesis protein YqeC [Haloferax namakaokahaiae]|uniref:Selenium cofactor biosynthesis protein YqeC n=1 Tax=Haloferax namakaokahaiae TaxID=1748331 RepID=A0ABD5ZG17_9EURY